MATKFVLGRGSVLSISTDGGTTYIPLGQIKTCSFSGSKTDFEDVTNFDSTLSVREFAPTLIDPGQVTINGVFNPDDAGQTALQAAFNASTLLTVKLVLAKVAGDPTALQRQFTGYVQDHNIDVQHDKATGLACTIRITAPIIDTMA